MPTSRSPEVQKGALVRLDDHGVAAQVVAFQYNPEKLHRRLDERPSGPPEQVIICSLVLDATDALEFPDENPLVVAHGVYPMLAALELLMHPREARGGGSIGWPFWPFGSGSEAEHEPVLLFIWGDQRIIPVRLTRLDITEEQHDPNLHPVRATVRLRMQVVTDQDVPGGHRAAELWRQHLRAMQAVASGVYAGAPPLHIRG